MKKQIITTILTIAALSLNTAYAGVKSKHGGSIRTAGNMTMELVTKDNTATLYLEEKGKPVKPTGMIALMNIQDGTDKNLVMFSANGDKFEAKDVKFKANAKMVVTLTNAEQKKISATFGGK